MSKRTRGTSFQSEISKRLSATAGDTTYSHIARTLGTNHETVRRYLRGITAPSVEFLIRFSEMFRVDAGWLLTGRRSGADGVAGSSHGEIRLVEPHPEPRPSSNHHPHHGDRDPPNAPRGARRGGNTTTDGTARPDEVPG